jgi:nucleoside-diphosphate-sugar epimerase
MRIFMTGTIGFLGSRLTERLGADDDRAAGYRA